jgi:hypothetical protein
MNNTSHWYFQYFLSLFGFQLDQHGFRLEDYKSYVSLIQKIENMDDMNHNLYNNLFFDTLFDFNYNYLILIILGILVIPFIILGVIILESKGFNEGVKAIVNLGTALVICATLAGGGDSRDRDEKERVKEERKQREEEERKQKEEDEKRKKVDDNSIKIQYTNSNAFILS